ncbi:hypothetical protein GCM10022252_20080 [Streptosporangium oxazolinicum]|uniref:Uncharacterized protein n=1 Tax=Streptosporangium oxazolinicum TaxID=909287 RepID=A0ABP8ANW7_9ACTN
MSAYDADPWASEAPAADPWVAAAPTPTLPADEAQNNIPPSSTPTPSKERTITANNSTEAKGVTTTIKYGAGYDAPWTVFHSASVEEALNTLNTEAKALLELTAKVAKYAKGLDSGAVARPAAASGGGQAHQQTSTPPGQQGKSCAHGEMTYRTGTSGNTSWAGHFCSLPKGDPDQCKPIFVKQR